MHGHLTINTHILLTGATGYIGGSVLTRLLSHPLSETFQITVLLRDPSKATHFRTMGIKAVVGSHSDHDLLQKLAGDADVVFACADADDEGAARAVLDGLKHRHQNTGKVPSLIHTVFIYLSLCFCPSVSELNNQLETLPDTAPHRAVDLMLVDADTQGYVKTYIILPSTIYGKATGPLVDAGLQNPYSQQIPNLVDVALDRERAGMVGDGKNIWPDVHISDGGIVHDFVRFDSEHQGHGHRPPLSAKDKESFQHGRYGWYFAENGEHTLYQVADGIGKALVEFKKAKDASPTALRRPRWRSISLMERATEPTPAVGQIARGKLDGGRRRLQEIC
ncbi:hypothetical protein BDQ17DRAFT_1436193 [Cyathus striatus]|nr:hypothetical protein BDQ17DRAFT_1436193 [Cyathus striatus]